jgi:hypothetical protein
VLKVSPLSFKKIQEFTPACTIKKVIKKRPVSPISNFFPIEEAKRDFQVILKELVLTDGAKVRQES